MPSLVPEIDAYQAAQNFELQKRMAQLQQMGQIQGVLSRQQAIDRDVGLRGALSKLQPDATSDQVVQAVRPYASADDLLRITQGSADRRFATEQAAESRKDALTARLYDIDKRLEDKALDRTLRENLSKVQDQTRRELAQMGFDVRRELAGDKDKPQAVVGVDAQGRQTINWARPSQGPQSFDTRPPSLTTSGNQQALALRRDYNTNPEVKLANSLEPKVGPTAQYVAEVGKGAGNAVGDAELVKLWLMTTHPKGDQISNLDMRSIAQMPDLWGRVKNVAGNFVLGKTLDAETRADMWKSISQKFKATHAMREKYKEDVIGRGSKMGIDKSLIFSDPKEE